MIGRRTGLCKRTQCSTEVSIEYANVRLRPTYVSRFLENHGKGPHSLDVRKIREPFQILDYNIDRKASRAVFWIFRPSTSARFFVLNALYSVRYYF